MEFLKRILFISSIIILSSGVFFWRFKKVGFKSEVYVTYKIEQYCGNKLSGDLKAEYTEKSINYLYNRHKDNIYYKDFEFDAMDSIELSFIIYYALHPNAVDSIGIELREKVRTTKDIEKYLEDKPENNPLQPN